MEGKYFAMPNDNYKTKRTRESFTPYHEIERGFDGSVDQFHLIIQTPTDTRLEKQKIVLTDEISDPVLQMVDERCWQDDGGEGG